MIGTPPSPPTEFYARSQINRAFGLYGLGDTGTAVQTAGVGAVLGVALLGVVGTGLTMYFVYRVAKKQRWI